VGFGVADRLHIDATGIGLIGRMNGGFTRAPAAGSNRTSNWRARYWQSTKSRHGVLGIRLGTREENKMKTALASGFTGLIICLMSSGVGHIGTVNAGVDPAAARAILRTEVRETVKLYLDGKIDQWFSLEGRSGVAFILNVTDPVAAREMLEKLLPLGQAHLMTIELIPLAPLNPLRQLQGMTAGSPYGDCSARGSSARVLRASQRRKCKDP
jgi:hypothetical protein